MSSSPGLLHGPLRGFMVALAAAALVACGDDDGSTTTTGTTTSTRSGVAAVGSPIVGGTVNVACAGGSGLSTTTDNGGAWTVTTSGQTLPCAVQVDGGTVDGAANPLSLHSVAFDFSNVNVTPLTELVFANVVAGNPQAWFAASAPAFAALTAANVNAAVTQIVNALGVAGALGTLDPLTSPFQPVAGNAIDDVLSALSVALQALGSNFANLLAAAQANNFADFAGLPAAIAAAQGGGGGGSSGGSCTSGVEMAYSGTAGGGYTNGQKLCVEASSSTLKIGGKALGNPTANGSLTPPYTGYTFADGADSYEVVLKDGKPYEINFLLAGTYIGTFMPTAGALTIELSINGMAFAPIPMSGETPPASQAEFCADPDSNPNFGIAQGLSGANLAITDCTFANNVGTLSGIAQPGSLPFVVKFTWGG